MIILLLQWKGLIQYGDNDEDLNNKLDKRIAAQAPNRCCTLIYTVRVNYDSYQPPVIIMVTRR